MQDGIIRILTLNSIFGIIIATVSSVVVCPADIRMKTGELDFILDALERKLHPIFVDNWFSHRQMCCKMDLETIEKFL